MKKSSLFIGILVISIMMFSSVLAVTTKIYPSSNGAYSQWTNYKCTSSAEWACVDEDPFNVTDYLYTSTNNYKETFNFTDLGLTNESIFSVDLYYYAKRYSSTKYYIRPLIRSTSDYLGDNMYLSSSYAYRSQSFVNNPFTGIPWTVSQVNNLQAGMIANSTFSGYTGGYVSQMYASVDYDDPELDPDLVPINFQVAEYNDGGNETNTSKIMAYVYFQVNNSGEDTSGPSVASIETLTGTTYRNVTSLKVGSVYSVSTGTYNCTEPHNVTVNVDVYGTVTESNEGNNQQTIFVDCIV